MWRGATIFVSSGREHTMESCAMVAKPKQTFNNVIPRLRKIAGETSDFELSLKSLAVVASVTGEGGDIRLALHKAHQAGLPSSKAEALAVLVKILAEARRFEWARRIATEMLGIDRYWYAVARMWIAGFSGEAEDIALAESAINSMNAGYLKVDARHDMAILLSKKHHHTGISRDRKYYEHLTALLRALTELKAFEDDAHRVRPLHTSAHFYHQANGAISWFFADLMD